MKFLVVFVALTTILQAFLLSLYYLMNVSIFKKIFESLILLIMIIFCYINLVYMNKIIMYISLFFSVLILLNYIKNKKKNNISILSVKNGIDMSNMGILFLDDNDDIILINNMMSDLLKNLDIKSNYLVSLINNSFRKLNNAYLIKYNNHIYQLDCLNKMIILIDITELYVLEEKEEMQNRLLEENNKKILKKINNIEKIEKNKNLLKIKNEYHDILGYHLALITKYLEQNKKNINDIDFLLDSIYKKFNSSQEKLDNLLKMYSIMGINISINNRLPLDEKVASIFFEIIREGITNAIIHADSKNIDIELKNNQMVIKNDGKMPYSFSENEGIKGMRRKLKEINGSLKIVVNDEFILIVDLF